MAYLTLFDEALDPVRTTAGRWRRLLEERVAGARRQVLTATVAAEEVAVIGETVFHLYPVLSDVRV